MAAQQQKIRLEFLIVLTLVVLLFGGIRLLKTLRITSRQRQYAQTERVLQEYTRGLLESEEQELQDIAIGREGREHRDAAALLVQSRYLLQSAPRQPGRPIPPHVAARFEHIEADFRSLRDGQPVAFPRGEPFLRAYYAPVDGSFQPYGISVPDRHGADNALPLIVEIMPASRLNPFACRDVTVYDGAISVRPTCRGDGRCVGLAEDDVMSVMEDVSALYNIDQSRVFLIGRNEGNTGACNLAARYPHVFSGVIAMGDAAVLVPSTVDDTGEWSNVGAIAAAAVSPVPFLENLERCTLVAASGLNTPAPADGSVVSLDHLLQKKGLLQEYLEFPQTAGALPEWSEEYALARVFGATGDGSPLSFRFKTADLRHNAAWWVRIDQIPSPLRPAEVEAAIDGEAATILTRNVTALALLFDAMPTRIRSFSVDGTQVTLPQHHQSHVLRMVREADQWHVDGGKPVDKRPGMSGPFGDVLRDPFLVVYGSAGDDALHSAVCRSEAERFAAAWQRRYNGRPRVKNAAEVTAQDIRRYNLVLLGPPSVNALVARAMDRLPIRVDDDGVRMGEREFLGESVGTVFCYPNPLNPKRMVGVVAGASPGATYQALERCIVPLPSHERGGRQFDFAVFDSRAAGPDSMLMIGFFDRRWRVPAPGEADYVWEARQQTLAALQAQGGPRYLSAAETDSEQVALSDVLPQRLTNDGVLGLDRTPDGRAIVLSGESFDRGLVVSASSSLSVPLGGRFRTFTAEVGLPGPAVPNGRPGESAKAIFEVLGDGRQIATAGPFNWEQAGSVSRSLAAGVAGVQVLTLRTRVVDGDAPPGARCAWAHPVVKR